MILDEQLAAGNPKRFGQKRFGGIAMVEYVDEEHVIKGLIVVGDALTIEESDGHPSAGSLCNINPRDLEPWFSPAELLGQGPVSAAHIEEGALLGK